MVEVTVRKQGGAAILTIPSDMLKMLDIDIGTKLGLDVVKGMLTARPVRAKADPGRRHYTIAELLEGVTEEGMKAIYAETAWASEGAPIGRELV